MLKRTKKLSALLLALIMVLSLMPMNVFAVAPTEMALLSNRDNPPTTQAELTGFRAAIRYNRHDVFQDMRLITAGVIQTPLAAAQVPLTLPRDLNRDTDDGNTLYPVSELAKMMSVGFDRAVVYHINPETGVVAIQIMTNVGGITPAFTFVTAPGREMRVRNNATMTLPALASAPSNLDNGWMVGDALTVKQNGRLYVPMRGILQAVGVRIGWNSGNHDLTFYFPTTPVFLFHRADATANHESVRFFRDILTGTWQRDGNVWTHGDQGANATFGLRLTIEPTDRIEGQRFAALRNMTNVPVYVAFMAGDRMPREAIFVAGPIIRGYAVGDIISVVRHNLISGDAHVIRIPAGGEIALLFD